MISKSCGSYATRIEMSPCSPEVQGSMDYEATRASIHILLHEDDKLRRP